MIISVLQIVKFIIEIDILTMKLSLEPEKIIRTKQNFSF